MPINCFTKGQTVYLKPAAIQDDSRFKKHILATINKVDDTSLLVGIPVKELNLNYFIKGATVILLTNNKGSLFTGESKIINTNTNILHWLWLSFPSKIQRVEMRKWFRVPVNLKTRYRLANYNMPYYETTSLDISGGGIQILSKHVIDKGLELEICLDLPDQSILKGLAKVRRCEEQNTRWGPWWGIGCSFERIKESDQDKLIKFLFKQQRVLIQKGLYDDIKPKMEV